MNETILIEKVMLFGLSRQEATIYICLLKAGALSGYEVAKCTGISRSNVYSALAGLTEKGGAYLMEASSSKYVAVTIDEFCTNKINALEQEKKYLIDYSPKKTEEEVGYITITGYKNCLNKIWNIIQKAKYRIYISATAEFIEMSKSILEEVIQKNIKVVLITDSDIEMKQCIFYLADHKGYEIRLIVDSEYVMTGELKGNDTDTFLYSGQKNFVNVFKEAMRNEIKLLEMGKKKGLDE